MKRKTKVVAETRKIVGGSGKEHTCTLYDDGTYWCTCAAFKFQKGPVEQRRCKHTCQAFGFPVADVQEAAQKFRDAILNTKPTGVEKRVEKVRKRARFAGLGKYERG